MSACKDCNGTGHIVGWKIEPPTYPGVFEVQHCKKCGGCGRYAYGQGEYEEK